MATETTRRTNTLVQATVVKDGQDGAKKVPDGASGRDGKEVVTEQ